jgi:glucose/arabinose dehydrogenase
VTRRAVISSVLVAGTIVLAACASDDSAGPPSADTAADTAADVEQGAPDASTTTSPLDDLTAEPSTEPTTAGGPTTTLVPAADADLPTARPGDESGPPTTAPGPLARPEVSFVELGSYDEPVDAATRELDTRLFVVQQGGQIVAFDDESDTVVLDMTDVDAVDLRSGGEQGLLGLAFHPMEDLAYVNFTNDAGTTVVAEFAVDELSGRFDPASYREVLTIEQPFPNHNGGDLEFGPDGYLYIATGDGGSGGDPERFALDLTSRLGKLLRIDPRATDDAAFRVPSDNPYLGADDADPTIWSSGLRNPWKFSFDPVTNDLWVADVGQNQLEEVSVAPAVDGVDAGRAVSFGWSAFEGDQVFNADEPADGHLPPVHVYPHDNGDCSISGGVVARNSSYRDLNGWYVFGDFCSGRLWALDTTSVGISDSTVVGEARVVEIGTVPALAAVVEGADDDIYALSRNGQLVRIAPA